MAPLIEQLSTSSTLSTALDRLKRGAKAAGIDGVTPAMFRERRSEHLARISQQLADGTYKYSNLKAVALPKESGGHRMLSIPTVADRVVQKAILGLLPKQIFDAVRSPGSHAYQSQRSFATAVNDLKYHISNGKFSIIQTDIEKFFDRASASKAIEMLTAQLPDDSLSPLLAQYVGWEVDGLQSMPRDIRAAFPANGRTTGLPQGTALAPVLSNLLLAPIDRAAKQRGIAVVRYADDVAILAATESSARDAFNWYKLQIESLGLTIYDPASAPRTKARVIDDVRQIGVDYLGCFVEVTKTGIRVRPQNVKVQSIIRRISGILLKRGRAGFPSRIIEADAVANAWIASYRKICGMGRAIRTISDAASESIESLLRSKKILAPGQMLSQDQRAFLGFSTPAARRLGRPTRARQTLPKKPKP